MVYANAFGPVPLFWQVPGFCAVPKKTKQRAVALILRFYRHAPFWVVPNKAERSFPKSVSKSTVCDNYRWSPS